MRCEAGAKVESIEDLTSKLQSLVTNDDPVYTLIIFQCVGFQDNVDLRLECKVYFAIG